LELHKGIDLILQYPKSKGNPVHQMRKEWIPVTEIRKDAAGCMIDPNLVQRFR